ncbi:hypothetical protein KAU33_13905, partial [Candidatus Dependentiae bacterium]|nr:hypothetical protein [Candidatus Dependentiae bacterium]
MDPKIEIKTLESLKKDVLPGDKFRIISKVILISDVKKKCELNFSLVGTNVKKETLKIPLEKKSVEIIPNSEEAITWEIKYPDDARRFNFGGYLQWYLPENMKSGIIFKNLFTAGSDYNLYIKDSKPVFDDAKKDKVSKFFVEIENEEIDKLDLNIRIIIRDENEDEIMYLEKDVTINYHLKLLFDLDITLKHLTNYQFKVICSIKKHKIKETEWEDIFPIIKKRDFPLKFDLQFPYIEYIPGREEELYKQKNQGFQIKDNEEYQNLKILKLTTGDYIYKFKGIVVYGLNWDQELEKNPILFEEFRNELFSYVFFINLRTKEIFPKEKKIWEANSLLMEYFGKVLKTKFSQEVQKLQIFLNRVDILQEIVKEVLILTQDLLERSFITPHEYKVLFDMKKNYYINYLSLKNDSGILSEKEEKKIHSLIDFMEREKTYLRNLFVELIKKYKGIMDRLYRVGDYNTNLEIIGIPEEMHIVPDETYLIRSEIINSSLKNNLYFTVKVDLPKGITLLSPKEDIFPFIAYKSNLVEINNFEL